MCGCCFCCSSCCYWKLPGGHSKRKAEWKLHKINMFFYFQPYRLNIKMEEGAPNNIFVNRTCNILHYSLLFLITDKIGFGRTKNILKCYGLNKIGEKPTPLHNIINSYNTLWDIWFLHQHCPTNLWSIYNLYSSKESFNIPLNKASCQLATLASGFFFFW